MEPIEMLTIKECAKLAPGLSVYSIRKLIQQDKIKYIRAGEGKNGKYLIYKNSFTDHLKN